MIFYVERQKQTLEVVKMSNQLIKCKVCGEEIAKGAKTCPKCGNKNKKPFYKKWWFIALVIVIVIAAIASSGGDETAPVSNGGENTQTQTETQSIEYVAYNVSDMMEDLENNAMNAENKYNNQYVEITGRLSNIDSDGSYIDLMPTDNEFAFIGVQCYIKTDEQKQKIATLSKGDIITLRGKITGDGEIMGYSLNITEFK